MFELGNASVTDGKKALGIHDNRALRRALIS